MIETIIASLSVATISAITFIAYKHPLGYRKLYTQLSYVLLGVFILLATWNLATLFGSILSLQSQATHSSSGTINVSVTTIVEMGQKFTFLIYLFLIEQAIWGYLFFLLKLPTILEDKRS